MFSTNVEDNGHIDNLQWIVDISVTQMSVTDDIVIKNIHLIYYMQTVN